MNLHPLFANDTLHFYKDNEDRLKYRKWIVMCFALVSDLKINLQKAKLFQWGPQRMLIEQLLSLDVENGNFTLCITLMRYGGGFTRKLAA